MKARNIILAVIIACFASSCNKTPQVQLVIMETDIGNDVDDALAMDLLYKYQEEGRINLLMVGVNKDGTGSAEYLDILNTWYGYPDIPIGVVRNGAQAGPENLHFAKKVTLMKNEAGEPLFARSHPDYDNYMDAHILYRKVLAQQPDHSVTIASVGFSTNLVRLLNTPADEYSKLTGKELVAKKVKLLVTMAGNFENPDMHEYNVAVDIPAAKTIFEQWPTPVVTSPWEVGNAILYPGSSIENDFNWAKEGHPVAEGYKAYMEMPYDRQTWDPTAVLYAVEGGDRFTVSPAGNITVTDEGSTLFTPDENGTRRYLSVTPEQADSIKAYFIERITRIPVHQAK